MKKYIKILQNKNAKNLVPSIMYNKNFLKKIYLEKKTAKIIYNSLCHGCNVFESSFDNSNFFFIVKECKLNYLNSEVIHFDFQKVSLDDIVSIKILFKFIGFDKSPALKKGAYLLKYFYSTYIQCKVLDIPNFLDIDISKLDVNMPIFLSDLSMKYKNIHFIDLKKSNILIAKLVEYKK